MALTIHFIDVGQGDCIYLRYDAPDELPRHILVDGGRASAAGRVSSYLQRQGVTRLHLVVATHVDDDHISGLLEILSTFPVARFWGPDPQQHQWMRPLAERVGVREATTIEPAQHQDVITIESVNTYDRLHAMALGAGVLVEYPIIGHDASHLFPGLELRVMGPTQELARGALNALDIQSTDQAIEILSANTNNSSIIMRAGLNGQHVLLTGDAEMAEWHAMISQWGAGLHARVLKISHHGSRNGTNAQVLEMVRPRQVVISVGPNSYGHPDPNVVDMLAPPMQLYRTDQQGAIVIRFEAGDAAPLPHPASRSWWQRLLDWMLGRPVA